MWNLDRKGFTLVEIMIVVIIIGILAAIAIPNFMSTRSTAQQEACIANLRQLDAALEMYRIDKGYYPTATSWDKLRLGEDLLPDTGDEYLDPYMKDVDDCPGTGTYSYNSTSGNVTCSASGHSI